MEMGGYIKQLRTDMGLTQEELGNMLVPKVNRQAVNNWEHGRVENIRRSHIAQMAQIFDVSPVDLMCLTLRKDTNGISDLYSRLDDFDKGRVTAYIENILMSDKYKKGSEGVG